MPLHLLSKKSWNVYAPQNVARVKADEAAAAADEEKHEQSLRDYETEVRLAHLRGEAPPSPPPEPGIPPAGARKRGRDVEASSKEASDGKRKRRRLHGEDDTDRDIRLAREDGSHGVERRGGDEGSKRQQQRRSATAAPLKDQRGNIQLFAPPSTSQIRAEKEEDLEKQRKQRKGEEEGGQDQGMRFKDAAGRGKHKSGEPWYASHNVYSGTEELVHHERSHNDQGLQAVVGKDAFGRDDPSRPRRDAARLSAADPMAAMSRAQDQLRSTERKREAARREREQDLGQLRREQELDERMRKRKRRDGREEVRSRSDARSRREYEARHEQSRYQAFA